MPPKSTKLRRALILITGTVAALALAPVANAATFTVTSTADAADAVVNGVCATSTGACTLRAAVQEANVTAAADTITLPAGTFTLATALPALTNTVTISGAKGQPGAAGATTISGAAKVRILDVAGTATVQGVVLDQGAGGTGKGGAASVRLGATLTLLDSTVRRSTAAVGAGLYNGGTLVVRRSTLSDNTASDRGGAIYADGPSLTLENSTLSGNVAVYGGAIKVAGGTATIAWSTLTANRASSKSGGGLYRFSGTVTVSNSIIAGNLGGTATAPTPQDCYGGPSFTGTNLVGTTASCTAKGVVLTGDPQLGPLADNGGPTLTRAIPATSPAVDRIATPCAVATDQRGTARPGGASCDIGAFERSVLSLSATLKAVAQGTSTPGITSVSAGAVQAPVDSVTSSPTLASAGSANLAAAILRSVDVQSSILRSVTLEDAILRSVTLDPTILRSVILRSVILRSVMLSDVPVTVDGGWDAILKGTAFEGRPLQTLSLADVIELPSVRSLSLSQIDLSQSALGSTAIAAILVGDVNLASLPLTDQLATGTDTERLAAWCAALPAGACADLGVDPASPVSAQNTTLMSVALSGIRIDATILRSVILRSVILRSVDPNDPSATILRSVILRSVDLGATILRSVILRSVPTIAAPGCTGACLDQTLAAAQAAGSLGPNASLGDLLAALEPYLKNPTLDPAITKLVGGLSLGDVLPGLIEPQDVQWDTINVSALNLPAIATPPAGIPDPTFDYLATLTVGSGPATVTGTLTLPADFVPRGAPSLDGTALPTCTGAAATAACADVSGRTLTLRAPGLASGAHTLRLSARAGIVLGSATATIDATAADGSRTATANASTAVTVTELLENGDTAASVLAVQPPLLTVSQVGKPADRDWYSFTITPDQAARGVRASAILANLAFDGDLVLFGPADDPLRGAPQTRLTAVEDAPSVDPTVDTLPTETLADVPLSLPFAPNAVALDVSATRGLQDERIDSAELRAGTYYLQVSGFNGASSPDPYSVRLRLVENPATTCTTSLTGTPGTLPDLTTLPAGLNTVFLVNRQRLEGAFGAAEATRVVDGLQTLAGRADLGVVGAVIPVDGDAAVRAAYAAWDGAACSPDAANDVVRSVGALLDRLIAANPGVTNVVVVGDDTQIPQARVQDGTKVANERAYGASIGRSTPEGASLSRSRVLSDNPYASVRSIGVNGHELFIPKLGVGRLVETPDEILASVKTFQDFNGTLDPSTRRSFVSGYDFLSDGSQAVKANLAPMFSAPDRLTALINETWTRSDLASNLLPSSGASPLISSVNAHFDHFRALPAFENAQGTTNNLFTTSDLGPAGAGSSLAGTLLFSMGCHSGLSVSDVAVGLPASDWAQTLNGRGATLVGNTGFGYGDTETVALSERLMAGFAGQLKTSATIGQALTTAKRVYFADTPTGSLSPYDEKVLEQATFYGLPMYRVAGATPTPPAGPSTTGLFDVDLGDPTTTASSRLVRKVTTRGLYYSVDGATMTVQNRPIQPKTSLSVDRAGQIAHGAIVTTLESVDLGAFDPVYFRPAVDLSLDEPEVVGADAVFPAAIQSVTPALSSDDPFQRLVLVPGQFREPVAGTGVGTQRLFTRIGGQVLYTTPDVTDFTAPRIVTTSSAGRTITVTTDDTAQRVLVLFRPRAGNTEVSWGSLDLVRGTTTGGVTTWSAPLPASAPDAVQFIVQAPDASGNVGISTNKGDGYAAGAPPAASVVTLALSPAPASPLTWVVGPVQATLTSSQGLPLEYSIDGAPFQPYTGPVSVTGDGTHTVQGRDANGGSSAEIIRIDATDPSLTLTTAPAPTSSGWSGGPVTVGMDATDGAGSGVVSLTYSASGAQDVASRTVQGGSATLDITAEGITTVRATATDAAGRTTAKQVVVRIDTTDPTASITATPPPVSGWWTGPVTLGFSGGDSGSGVASLTYSTNGAQDTPATTVQGATTSLDVTAEGTTHVTLVATDDVGRTATATYTVRIDATDPTATITPTPAPNADGWWQGTATLALAGDDGTGSGIATLTWSATGAQPIPSTTVQASTATLDITAEGSTTVTLVATDVAGRTTTTTQTVLVDATDPTPTITPTPAANPAGWWQGPVILAIGGTDAGSGVAKVEYSSTGDQVTPPTVAPANAASLIVSAEGTTIVSVTATDVSGRTATRTFTVKIDDTDPTATIAPGLAGNAAGWWNAPVTLAIGGGDGGSGLATVVYSSTGAQVTDPSVAVGNAASLVVSAEGTTVVSATSTDLSGRSTTSTFTVNLDRTAPTIAIRSPVDGSSLQLGSSVLADYSCTDALSGSPTCDGPVASGTTFTASTPGQQTFTVTSTDVAGNTATCSVKFSAQYRICVLRGDDDNLSAGAIPIRLRLCTALGVNLSSASIVLTATGLDANPPIPNYVGNANSGFQFRFTGGAYTYNLQTSAIPASSDGRHTLSFTVGSDPSVYTVTFSTKRS